MKKKSILAAALLLTAYIAAFIPPAFAAENENESESKYYLNVYTDYYDYYGYNDEVKWSGKIVMKANTIYYVDSKITVSKVRNLPESSMLVVKRGGHITVSESGALYVQGHFGIEDGGIVEVNQSKLVLNSGSVSGVNGSLYINSDSQLKIYSKLFVYRNGLLSLSGSARAYTNGRLYYANEIRIYNNGNFSGTRERISGMSLDRYQTNIELKNGGFMRFYDRQNKVTYKITNQQVIKKICDALNKIKLIPVRESTVIEGTFENRFGIRLYDASGNEYFYFERPENESEGFVYINGITYAYPDSCLNFDEFYYYALGVRSFYKR